MIDFTSWVTAVVEALTYVLFGPFLILYAAFGAVIMISAFAVPIWGAIFGRVPGDRGEPAGPIVRLVVALAGLGLLWQMVAPWL